MLGKCLATSLFLFFLCLTLALYSIDFWHYSADYSIPKLILSSCGSCELSRKSLGPPLESVIQASISDEGRELRFPGLAVTSTLKDACQPLTDVSKAKIPANKIALVILLLEDETSCPMQHLALEAQRAGYSVLIYFANSVKISTTPIEVPSKEILLIPVLEGSFSQLSKTTIFLGALVEMWKSAYKLIDRLQKNLTQWNLTLKNFTSGFLWGQSSHSSG